MGLELVLEEPVLMVEVEGHVNFFSLSLSAGAKMVFHKRPMPYHRHDKEIDLLVTGGMGVGGATPQLPGQLHTILSQGFAGAEISGGRKEAFVFHDTPPFGLHRWEGGSANVAFVGLAGGMRSFLADQGRFAYWNQVSRELTVYEGTGGRFDTPPSHHLQAWSRRFQTAGVAALFKVLSESLSFGFLDGVQKSFRLTS